MLFVVGLDMKPWLVIFRLQVIATCSYIEDGGAKRRHNESYFSNDPNKV